MAGITGEVPQEDTGGGRWLSYTELAEIRGIGRESAVKLAQREQWPRRPGNDGTARVLVPLEYLKPAKPASGERPPEHTGEQSGELSRALSDLKDAVAFVRERAEAAERRAEAAESDRRAAEARANRAEQAVAGERTRADALRERLDAAEASAEQAEARGDRALAELERARAAGIEALQTAEALRQAEAERRAKSLLARLRAALRRE